LKTRPYDDGLLNFVEIFNEATLLICSYILLLFTDYIEDAQMRSDIGWVYGCIVAVNLIVNWLILFGRFIKVTLGPVIQMLLEKRKAFLRRINSESEDSNSQDATRIYPFDNSISA
jgi:hypothetical protein